MTCFLSYSSADHESADALHKFLSQQGEDVFFAPRSHDTLLFGAISDALQGCSRFVYLNSKTYIASKFCKMEWSAILSRIGANDEDFDIIGVMLDDTEPPELLKAWLYIGNREVGTPPARNTGWMSSVLRRIQQRRAASDEKLSQTQAEARARDLSQTIMSGPENVDLLTKPIMEWDARRRMREGVIFLKPQGTYNPQCIQKVVTRLLQERVNVLQVRKYTGSCIQQRGLFDQHYFGPVTIAQQESPELDEQEVARLHRYYFDRWKEYYGEDEEPSLALVIPALRLLEPPYGLTADEISEIWDRGRSPRLFWNEKPDGLNKIGYQKSVFAAQDPRIDGGRPRLILNGYVPGYKKLLEEPADEVRAVCFRIATDQDWDKIRDDVLGGNSNPAKCKPSTLRRQAFENQEEFGIEPRYEINGQQNLLHASATALEGIYEISLWFDVALDDTYLGAFLANRLGAEQLPDLFFRFHEFLSSARGKDIEELVQEALSRVPDPEEAESVPGFNEFKSETLKRYAAEFTKEFSQSVSAAEFWEVPAIRHIVELGYAVRCYGYKALVEKFLPAFQNQFFREKCRQFCNVVAHIEHEQLEREPELVGLAVRVVCSDLLILSSTFYPDDFISEFLADLHERAREIALRTRANAMKQCAAALRTRKAPPGEALGSLKIFDDMKQRQGSLVRVNVGRGTPDIIAIVAAGGRSTRAQSIIPKPILRLQQKFLIEHVLDNIRAAFHRVQIFVSVGWESELLRACLSNQYRYLTLSSEESKRNRHMGLGPGARLYAALLQLEPFSGPILACYSDMPMVRSASLKQLEDQFESTRCKLSFATVDNAPLPGHVVRDHERRVERVAHSRYGPIEGSPERDAGFYMFRNIPMIREALAATTNANVKREYGIHEIVEALATRDAHIETVKIPLEECWTVNNASDLFWLATGLYRESTHDWEIKRDYESFRRDYGATFDYDWFSRSRGFLKGFFNPVDRPDRPDMPLHFVLKENLP